MCLGFFPGKYTFSALSILCSCTSHCLGKSFTNVFSKHVTSLVGDKGLPRFHLDSIPVLVGKTPLAICD